MAVKESFDFLRWTSFPSSLRADNDEGVNVTFRRRQFIPIKAPATIRVEGNIKVENGSIEEPAWIAIVGWDAAGREIRETWFHTSGVVSKNWVKMETSKDMPAGIANIELRMVCAGSGVKGKVAITWFDDLKIYANGKLIYANDFSNWNPYIGAGLGGLSGVGAFYLTKNPVLSLGVVALGAFIGGGVGVLTAKP